MNLKKLDWTIFLNKENRLYRHLFFWLMVTLWPVIFKAYPKNLTSAELACNLLQGNLQLAIPAYINNYLVLPFFKNKKIRIGIILFISQIVLMAFLLPVILDVFIPGLFVKLFNIQHWNIWGEEHLNYKIVGFVIMASVFKYAKDSFVRSKEQNETELRHLKNQLNPHFLFNTLNNLYGLAVGKSDKLPPLMIQLSELLRYSVYETEHKFVPLEKELTYMENYIKLEEIRLNEDVHINFNQSGDFTGKQIAPLVLIVFIENSFKHYSHKMNQDGYINIKLEIQNNKLLLNVKNSLDSSLYDDVKCKKGIGLINVQKRLDMLYPNNYKLKLNHKPDFYEVCFKLYLNK